MRLRQRVPPWYDGELYAALKLKELRYKAKKKLRTTENIQLFKQARKHFQKLAKNKYLEYITSVAEGVKTDARRFYSYASISMKGAKYRIPEMIELDNDIEYNDNQSQADIFSSYFESVFNVDDNCEYPEFDTQVEDPLRVFSISHAEVRSELLTLNSLKAMC